MAMAFRSMVGKLVISKLLSSYCYMASGSGGCASAAAYPFHYAKQEPQIPNRTYHQEFLFRRVHRWAKPKIELTIPSSTLDDLKVPLCAHFAVEAFNEQKDAKLQFVGLVRASYKQFVGSFWNFYLTIEAVDAADGMLKVYKALVSRGLGCERMSFKLFGQVLDEGRLLKLVNNYGPKKN